MNKESQEDLMDAEFSDGTMDFFGETEQVVEPVAKEETETGDSEEEEEEEETSSKEKPKKEKEDDIDPFEGFGTESEESDDEEDDEDELVDEEKSPKTKNKKEKSSKVRPLDTLKYLEEKGLLKYELEEGEELTDDLAEEILEDSFDSSVDAKVSELFADLPDPIKQLNKYVLDGGDPAKFLSQLAKGATSRINESLDITKEENQELVVREQLSEEGYDQDYIDTQVEFLKDTNKLEKISKTHFDKWKNKQKDLTQKEVEAQASRKLKEKEDIRKAKLSAKKLLEEKKEYNGLAFNRKDKTELPSYIHDRTYKLQNGKEISEMQKDLYEAISDPEKSVMLAKILKSGFDFKTLEVTASDKVAKDVKNNIRRTGNSPSRSAKRSSQSNKSEKSLADYF